MEVSKPFEIDIDEYLGYGCDCLELDVMACEDCPDLVDSSIDSLEDCLVYEGVILEDLHNRCTNLQQRINQLLAEIEVELSYCRL